MAEKRAETLPEDRTLSDAEVAVVEWLLHHGDRSTSFSALGEAVGKLRVVGRCGCGCASVDFVKDGQNGTALSIAESLGSDSRGRQCGIILWSKNGALSGLEIYECEPGSAAEIPSVETLRSCGAT
jgi:hypothetical protein